MSGGTANDGRPDSDGPQGKASNADVVIVGAGAAGLATAIFVRELAPSWSVVLLDSARRPGAKILVSGGGRCNVTNVAVAESDFCGGSRTVVRQVLRALPVAETRAFFSRLGVSLHEEPLGKLFPESGKARTVLDALLGEAARLGVALRTAHRVVAVERLGDSFSVQSSGGAITARRLVLATGGQSLPRSGSDGHGYTIARALGHTIVPTTPALAPLTLDGTGPQATLSGVTHPAELTLWIDGRVERRIAGSLLWTHFGLSGPVALDISRHWARAQLERRHARVTLSFVPGMAVDAVDTWLVEQLRARPRAALQTLLAERLPASVAAMVAQQEGLDERNEAGGLSRAQRRRTAHRLTAFELAVTGTRGYNHAEVTAGGVSLDEVMAGTLESRLCPGLSFAGEILDVDGRLGGFNFQWAWASARAVARGMAARASGG